MRHADGISPRRVDLRLKAGDLFGVFVVIVDELGGGVAHAGKHAMVGKRCRCWREKLTVNGLLAIG